MFFVEAGIANLVKTLFIIIGILAILRLIGRIILAKKMNQLAKKNFQNSTYTQKEKNAFNKQVGKVEILSKKTKSNNSHIDPGGDYVDYEEIE